ncbi:hypothetical protein CVT25_014809 [Psilocybe cyanescens]|uniref:Rsm22-domain-containing protein n=1 Tax=Psilocybe cyanescens TaxID=93625 RepID=A0A409WEP7_PSICY|nr:hypothetical protein CVT25_014809 [Psilocybe cyanescens]
MLRKSFLSPLRTGNRVSSQRIASPAQFSSPGSRTYAAPKSSLNLDPSYQALLNDINIALNGSRASPPAHRELEVVQESLGNVAQEQSIQDWMPMEMPLEPTIEDYEDPEHRKSPAALYGSKQISMVVLPEELKAAVNLLISDEATPVLRSDSTRLFKNSGGEQGQGEWDTMYNTNYSSREQTLKHAVRDGMAFATVALPAHYSAIMSVLLHIKLRLEPTWEVNKIIDWGAGTGSGLWASAYSFQDQNSSDSEAAHDATVAGSSIKSYIGIEKRVGLVSIGKRLIAHTPKSGLNVAWKKSFREEDKVLREEGSKTVALSAFALTSLSNTMAQKTLVQEMWESGAHTIVLIDHNTQKGFQAVAQAREYLLRLGKDEVEDPETAKSDIIGSHVLAPCPHDHKCPLLKSGGASLTCGFLQRLQRPPFMRQTKQTGVGHEDIGYSYAVIRRGPRPSPVNTSVGRVGAIGKRAMEVSRFANEEMRELEVEVDETGAVLTTAAEMPTTEAIVDVDELEEPSGLQAALRKEAYNWPRLVFPPLKKPGHIILDSCTKEGKIMRVTIPKSQGKQPFYDARKSSWGDIFPHMPKNTPLERQQPRMKRGNRGVGGDIGKRKDSFKVREKQSYGEIALSVREKKKQSKQQFARTRGDKVWQD